MLKLIQYAKITALAAVAFLCITLGLAGLQLRKAAIGLEQTEQTINTLVGHADTQVQAVGSEAHRVLLEAGLTAMEARKASKTQREFWDTEVPALAAKSETTIDRTNALLGSLEHTSDGLNKNTGLITGSFIVGLSVLPDSKDTRAGAGGSSR